MKMATWKIQREESLAELHPLTYCGAEQFLPVRLEIEDHALPGPWQSGPTDEQHQEDQVGKGSCHPNYLRGKKANSVVIRHHHCTK